MGLDGCTIQATEVHHMAGRGAWRLCYIPWFKSACHHCHQWVTIHSKQAIEMGLSFPTYKKQPVD